MVPDNRETRICSSTGSSGIGSRRITSRRRKYFGISPFLGTGRTCKESAELRFVSGSFRAEQTSVSDYGGSAGVWLSQRKVQGKYCSDSTSEEMWKRTSLCNTGRTGNTGKICWLGRSFRCIWSKEIRMGSRVSGIADCIKWRRIRICKRINADSVLYSADCNQEYVSGTGKHGTKEWKYSGTKLWCR